MLCPRRSCGSATRVHAERYVSKTQGHKGSGGAIEKAIEKAIHQLLVAFWIRTKIARTVDSGSAVIIA
jgi:hypothetical protein